MKTLLLIASTLVYPIAMFGAPWNLGAIDMGPVASGYLGLVLYSAAAVSLGLLVSALTDSQIIAFFITFMVLLVLHFLGSGLTLSILRGKAEFVATFISFDSRIAPFLRGMVNTRDVLYFLTVAAGCLIGSFWALERRKWA